jgi:ribosomal protein S18 acetylase RimI-like enzyme
MRLAGAQERLVAQQVMRRALRTGSAYVAHPGELDWWLFHADPRQEPSELHLSVERFGGLPTGMVELRRSTGEATIVGDLERLLPWVEEQLAPGPVRIAFVADDDVATQSVLARRGYLPEDDSGMPVFERDTVLDPAAGRRPIPPAELPEGFAITNLMAAVGDSAARGIDPAQVVDSRADAARRSFESTMGPAVHRARYRRFMASPGYVPEHDLVVIGPDGLVAAFAIWWRDDELGLAQFEPVGVDPPHQGRGLGRAVVLAGIEAMAAAGNGRARVMTDDDRIAASALYRSVGFDEVTHLRWWRRG